jgi:hypothetical protein
MINSQKGSDFTLNFCHVCFGLGGTDLIVTFKVFLLEFFSLNFTDMKFFYNLLDADGLHPKYVFISVVLKGLSQKVQEALHATI